ncbi:MAG: DUF1501 domain-containing protein [Leucothrix sp.]
MKNQSTFNRRDALKALLGAGATGALGTLGQLSLIRNAVAAPAFGDYKALVCVFLYGGNDSFNMLLPTDAAGHATYSGIRGDLAVSNTDLGLAGISTTGGDLTTGVLPVAAGNPYNVNQKEATAYLKGLYGLKDTLGVELGVNGVMPELAQLITDQQASVVANVGNLVNPVTRAQIIDKTADLPLHLFAHNHQQRALQTGQGNNLNDIGWAGRIADKWQDINGGSPLGLNISYFGSDRMLIGNETSPLVINPNSPPEHLHMRSDPTKSADADRRALFRALAGQPSATSRVNFGFENTAGTMDPFKNFYNQSLLKSLTVFDSLNEAWQDDVSYTAKDPYGNDLFSVPTAEQLGFSGTLSGSLIKQLEAVAQMIDLGAGASKALGPDYNRQVFMVRLGGFDTHGDQVNKHPKLLREISLALWNFQKALEEKGHADKTMTFTMSDFGRTMSNNGDGTDHAWGAHHIVMGGDGSNTIGSLKGGKMVGSLPDLSIGGADDYSSKGRIIPSLAQDQLNATLCSWFGIEDNMMAEIFPNIGHFKQNAAISSAYLDLIT